VQRRLWDELYERPNRDLFDLYYTNWASRDSLDEALERFSTNAPRMRATADTLPGRVARSIRATAAFLERPVPDVDVQVLVGLFSSDGWVTNFRGRRTLFLAAGYLPDYDDVFFAHDARTSCTVRRASTARTSPLR
jgi:hypothetical protein